VQDKQSENLDKG